MENKKKGIGFFDLTMIVISLVIGMGIFKTPVSVAAQSGSEWIFYFTWVLGGVIALAGALTYAEIGSRFPVVGGYYKIFSVCYHPSLSFSINSIILVSNAASVAAVALIGAEYINSVIFPDTAYKDEMKMWVAAISIFLFYLVNLRGLKMSTTVQNGLMIFKIGLMFLVMSALFFSKASPVEVVGTAQTGSWTDLFYAIGVCSVAVSFTYGGYQHSINFGREVDDAPRILPKAIFVGLIAIILLYVAINYAYVQVIGFENLKTSESIAAIMVSKIFGVNGYNIVSCLFFFSVLGYVNVMMLTNPRVMFAMSEEGTMPKSFKKVHPKTEVLSYSLTVFTIVTIFTLFYAKEFDQILNYIIFLDSIGMAFSAATLFYFRYKKIEPEEGNYFKISLYPILPIFYILAYTLIAYAVYVSDQKAALYGMGIFALFFVLYWIVDFVNKGKNKDQV